MVFVVVGDAAFEIQVFHSAAAGDNSADDLTSASELPPLLDGPYLQLPETKILQTIQSL
jgi:hypothetical protein